jgi:hypothetical protein
VDCQQESFPIPTSVIPAFDTREHVVEYQPNC